MTRSLRYAGKWLLWTFWGLFTAFFHLIWLMLVTGVSLGLAEAAVEALGWQLPLIVGPVVVYGVLLGSLAVAFCGLWDDRPRRSTWLVGRGDATLVRRDRFGKLWRLRPGWGGEVRVVEVVNATPEPDGSYRHYFLQVPPGVHTPREAVAWTFGFESAREFTVAVES